MQLAKNGLVLFRTPRNIVKVVGCCYMYIDEITVEMMSGTLTQRFGSILNTLLHL